MNQDIDEPFFREAAGAKAGINPMFGEWQKKFMFAPVPHGDGGSKRMAFQKQILGELTGIKWIYANELRLEITLHLDVQTILETSDTADLDNYAKSILDGLKGPDGIMLDDTQVQSLGLSWLDTYNDPYFVVEARSSPDDFLMKPVEFYEMPNGLWYPHSKNLWNDGNPIPVNELNHFADLTTSEVMSGASKRLRHQLRAAGKDRLEAYQISRLIASSKRGYHRSRIEGFVQHSRKKWEEQRAQWLAKAEGQALKPVLDGIRETYEKLVQAISNAPPK